MPSPNAKLAYKELARTWQGQPRVRNHLDAAEANSVDIATLEVPDDGSVAVGTLNLADHDLGMGLVRAELIGAFPASFTDAANVLATCAFNAFKDGMPVRPGAVHPRALEMYQPNTTVPHILMADPFLWPLGPQALACEGFTVAWLMATPISQAEWLFLRANGYDALTDRLEQANADVLDLFRPSVV